MSIEVMLEGTLEKEKDRETFSEFLKSICEEQRVHIEDYDTTLMMDICPEGFIECGYEDCFVSIAAQTNVAGPGFHAFVCSFFDKLIQESPIPLEVNDPTGYYEERDFESLKYKYFYQWLKDIASFVQEHNEDMKSLCISWPTDYYLPMEKEGSIVTPMGYISLDEFATLDIEELAQRFFIWNELEFQATYYRNCAISLLWKECFYAYSAMNEYSDKIANMIIDYIEAAYEKDNNLPLPMKAYHELCTAIQREDLIHHGVEMEGIEDIGYRKNLVKYPFGNWKITVDGCSEQGYDNKSSTLTFMAPYKQMDEGWKWLVRANAYIFEEEASFAEGFLCEEAYVIENQKYQARGIIQETEEYISLNLQYICGKEMLLLEMILRDREDVELMKEWSMLVEYQKVNQENEIRS